VPASGEQERAACCVDEHGMAPDMRKHAQGGLSAWKEGVGIYS